LRLLSRRARSAQELRGRLRRAGFEADVVEQVLADLGAAGLVDDQEFARSWVASRRAAGGAGRHKLRWELRQKGVAEHLIRQVVDEAITEEMETEQALLLARRRILGEGDAPWELARVRRLLLGRGYGFETVESVMRRIRSEGNNSEC